MRSILGAAATAAVILVAAQPANAGFTAFVIRNSTAAPAGVAPTINVGPTSTEFLITLGGQKAGLGSNDANGQTLGSITNLSIDRLDDETRFPAGSGPRFAPYLNFWITNGAGKFAVVANEPTNPDFQLLFSDGYSLDFADLADKPAKIFETSDKTWLPNNGIGLTFSDLAGFQILAPTTAQLGVQPGLTSGAPRELDTNIAYGVNWVFGDTLSNYVSGAPGYVVANAVVEAPEPEALALFGLGLAGLGFHGVRSGRRRRAQA